MKKNYLLLTLICSLFMGAANSQEIIVHYDTLNSGLPSCDIDYINIYGDEIWITTDAGMLRIKDNTWTVHTCENLGLPPSLFRGIFLDETTDEFITGYIVNNYHHGFAYFNGVNWTILDSIDPGSGSGYLTQMNSPLRDHNGTYWSANINGMYSYNGSNLTFYDYTNSPIPHFMYAILHSIFLDDDNSIWFAMHHYGIGNYDGENWTLYTEDNSPLLFQEIIKGIYSDSENNLWIPTDRCLAKFDRSNWNIYTEEDGIPNSIEVLTFDKQDNIWFSYDEVKLAKFDGTEVIHYDTIGNLLENKHIKDMKFDAYGNLWIATLYDGVYIFNEHGVNIEERAASKAKSCNVYPNPAQDYIDIELENKDGKAYDFKLYDLAGKKIMEQQQSSKRIGLQGIPNGIYIYTISNGQDKYTGKLLVSQ